MDTSILSTIRQPSDVKKLPEESLDALCDEIRETLIETVSRNGGHLASNLGTVELTVALYKCFNPPEDTIVWDVGHQAYAHKLLTGRAAQFDTLRTQGGISGFVRPDESVYDSFYEGHAGVSVSQAAGVAAANAIKGNKNFAVAVIGDGSFGNGMVYEALNHAGATKERLIVILNENEMSISQNVGSMAKYLATVRAKPKYYRLKAGTEKLLNKIPIVGRRFSMHVFKLKSVLKNMLYSSSFFEYLGFKYIGPIDGHNIPLMCEAMQSARMAACPVLLHVNTIKGKGYDFAENAPEKFHGISKFDVNTGEPITSGDSFSSQFGAALCACASKDKRICALTAAMSLGTGLDQFKKEYPNRFFDVGIAEEHAVTFASGLAAAGMLPVFAVYSTFLQRCMDQLIHDGALQRRRMVIAVDRAGFVGEDGETHQGLYDVPMLRGIPHLTIFAPATYDELNWALYRAFYKEATLSVIRYPRGCAASHLAETQPAPWLEDDPDGAQLCLVSYGRVRASLAQAAARLRADGVSVKVVSLLQIRPLPADAVRAAATCGAVLFFEEGAQSGGVGEAFGALLLEGGAACRYQITAVNDQFVAHAAVPALLQRYRLDAHGVESVAREVLSLA